MDNRKELDVLINSLNKQADIDCNRRLDILCEKIKEELADLTGIKVNYDACNLLSEEESHFQHKNPLMIFIRQGAISGAIGITAKENSWKEIELLHRAHFIRTFVEKTVATPEPATFNPISKDV